MLLKLRAAGLSAILMVLAVAPAAAQQICAQLQNQLTAIDQQGQGAAIAQYQRAQANYNAVYAQARQMGCLVLFRRFAPPQCAAVLQSLDQLQGQVAALDRAVRSAGQSTQARASILAAMQANNCGRAGTTIVGGERYRTVCVRPQDGYFFPINFSVSRNQFEEDQRLCEQQCIGATLYVYRNPGEAIEQAVSLNGDRYTEMPNAFAYQRSYDPANACRPDPNAVGTITAMVDETPRSSPAGAGVPIPIRRPVASEDPETLANRAGSLVPNIEPPHASDALVAEGGLRLIGPAFYYAH